jgi:aminopeptidase N
MRYDMKLPDSMESIAGVNYPPSVPFTIKYMWLRIEPDFTTKKITGEEQLKLLARQDVNSIELNIGKGVEIKSITFSTGADPNASNKDELQSQIVNGKLVIPLEHTIHEGTRFYVIIHYTAQGSLPGYGFHFASAHATFQPHAWTQSESIYARNWFPCIDHPQVKFPREISVVVPEDYIVISNGEIDLTEQEIQTKSGIKKKRFVWEEPNPNPAYLTSIVAGKFVETSKGEMFNAIPLRYYVPDGREEDAQRTFRNTANIMKIFEEYFKMKYPYNKYSQVVAKGLVDAGIAGMEHTTCTTLDVDDVLVESTAPADISTDDVIAHELAHQWFGDLVTCKDWQDIWLNEGFAAFCEALYFEKSKNEEQYQNYIIQMANGYLRGTRNPRSKTPIRAIVTNKYEHPDDLFDHNTYAKGGIVLHMLRKNIGDEDFRNSINTYLERFKHKTAETDNLRQIFEDVSGINLQLFFDQWIYREGHPRLKIHISDDNGKVKLAITQVQEGDAFVFPLDVKFFLTDTDDKSDNVQKERIEKVQISEKDFSKTFDVPMNKVNYIAIDPEFKILKEVLSSNIPQEFISNQFRNGKTIFERLAAAQFLKENPPSSKMALENMKTVLSKEYLSSVRIEALKVLGSSLIPGNSNDEAYEYLKQAIKETNDPRIRKEIIDSIGNFKKIDSFDLLKEIAQNEKANPYERYSAAIAISHTGHEESISLLKSLASTTSFHNLVSRGAIDSLKIIAINSNEVVRKDIEIFIIEKAKNTEESRLRRTATSALGYLGRYAENKTKIIEQLKSLLQDDSFYVRNTACVALANALEGTADSATLEELEKKVKEDPNSVVRSTAKVCIEIIKGESTDEVRGRSSMLEKEAKIDSKYKSEKFDLLESVDTFY